MQCWILCTYSALQISYFEVICSSVFFTMNKHDQKWYFEFVVYFILPILYNVVLNKLLYIFHSAISNNNLAKWTCIHMWILDQVHKLRETLNKDFQNLPSKRFGSFVIVSLSIFINLYNSALCKLHYQIAGFQMKKEIVFCAYSVSISTKTWTCTNKLRIYLDYV